MPSRISTLHKAVGIATLIIFILTGFYLHYNIAHIDINDEKLHMIFRANHIYIMFAGAINIGLGNYLAINSRRWRKIVQLIGSTLILLATLVLIIAFFIEPSRGQLHRPLTANAVFAVFVGSALHLIGGSKQLNRS